MKTQNFKIFFILLVVAFINYSCSNNEKITTAENQNSETKITGLRLGTKVNQFYYYSQSGNKTGLYRVYVDTTRNVISQYTSIPTNQSVLFEEFSVKNSTIHKNYNNSKIDFIEYEINMYYLNNAEQDPSKGPKFIIFSNYNNTDKFNFEKYNSKNFTFNSNFNLSEYYKKIN